MSASLLNKDMDLTPGFRNALCEIFGRYAKKNAGFLNEDELQEFAKFTNSTPFSSEELKEICENLKCTKEGFLLKEGFIQLYHLQTASGDDEETWKDLKKHGYDNYLKLVSKPKKQLLVRQQTNAKK
ncbi:hypothetical protein COEREDRAFT_83988 [Coemansia reversa NRRL 1564]|uniref:EF hand associated type-2 domain-containing protein n=1 Tax=Coemansia reversa (strain ATCC 12441 / NRRL 1564) TaxID=763665 RepID=A0A2G5B0W4_COERN|nr:hypothetical protein COEREDRAFT_83988 [Coemansia reversa NRRL 1564]|eukprot:PIA12650.1 hypothetical protein COEREDRAFT_83988 [Coemansia reversa NRRL 1564]